MDVLEWDLLLLLNLISCMIITYRSLPQSCVSSSCQSGGDGVLVVENVREEDAGYYMCTASIQGITSSTVCRVTLGGEATSRRPS